MRKILYRGMRLGFPTDSIIWSEGSLINNECYIDPLPKIYIGPKTGSHTVRPDSLCQFTGLTDSNQRRIWEKDVILLRKSNKELLVRWDDTRAAFGCVDHTGTFSGYLHEFAADCEVIDSCVIHPAKWINMQDTNNLPADEQ